MYSVNHMIIIESMTDAFCIMFPSCTPLKTCTSDVGTMAVGWPCIGKAKCILSVASDTIMIQWSNGPMVQWYNE